MNIELPNDDEIFSKLDLHVFTKLGSTRAWSEEAIKESIEVLKRTKKGKKFIMKIMFPKKYQNLKDVFIKKNGKIYFIISENGLIKIGFTTKKMDRRLKELQCYSPDKLEVLETIEGNTKLESFLHRKFKHLKSHGEWFKNEKELMKFICNLRKKDEQK